MTDKISGSELIFIGALVEKYSQVEPSIKSSMQQFKNGKVIKNIEQPPQIFTTFIFKVDEILKGEHQEKTIEVKMIGGCDEDAIDYCVDYSFNYDYEINDKAIMFLNKRKNHEFYKSSSGSVTAYTIQGSVKILTTEGNINYIYELDKNGQLQRKDVLTLNILRNTLENLKKQ